MLLSTVRLVHLQPGAAPGQLEPTLDVQVFRNDQITPDRGRPAPRRHAHDLHPAPPRRREAGVYSNEVLKRFAATTPILGVCLAASASAMSSAARWCSNVPRDARQNVADPPRRRGRVSRRVQPSGWCPAQPGRPARDAFTTPTSWWGAGRSRREGGHGRAPAGACTASGWSPESFLTAGAETAQELRGDEMTPEHGKHGKKTSRFFFPCSPSASVVFCLYRPTLSGDGSSSAPQSEYRQVRNDVVLQGDAQVEHRPVLVVALEADRLIICHRAQLCTASMSCEATPWRRYSRATALKNHEKNTDGFSSKPRRKADRPVAESGRPWRCAGQGSGAGTTPGGRSSAAGISGCTA